MFVAASSSAALRALRAAIGSPPLAISLRYSAAFFLASAPLTLSPTRFHNSVHNAAAGYWTIGANAMAPATAISALQGSFGQGLLESMVQLATGSDAVLLVAYDSTATGPLALSLS